MPRPPLPDPALGVFETLLVSDGEPVALDAHLERLRASLADLYGAPLPERAAALVVDAAAGVGLGRLRLDAVPDARAADNDEAEPAAASAPHEAVPVELDVRTATIDRAIVCPPWQAGLELRTVAVEGWNGGHKWVDRRLLEALDAEAAPDGALLTDADGALLETTRSNLFVVRADGVVVTPPADGRILSGVTRAAAIDVARATGAEVVEAAVARDDLLGAREAFATGSVRLVEPVRSLDGAPVGDPGGPVSAAVASALLRDWLG